MSAMVVYSSLSPSDSARVNRTSVPSGENAGWWSASDVPGSFCPGGTTGGPRSSTCRPEDTGSPGHSRSYTSSASSGGAQSGLATKHASEVTWVSADPSAAMIQIWGEPVRSLTKAIRDPSDDQ